jgi:integral membrane protein (TIGR01906 family)
MKPIKALLILLFPLLLTLLCVRLSFTGAFIDFLYPRVDLPPDPMPYEQRLNIAKLGLRSVLSDKGMEDFKNSGLFNYREIKHMEDVKRLLSLFFGFLYIGLPAWLLLFLSLKNLKEMGKVLFFGALLLELFALFVFFVSLTNYEWLFVAFHNLFFDPYSWRFRDEDMLLRVYPMDFWYKATIYTTLMVFFLNSVFQLIGLFLWRSRP